MNSNKKKLNINIANQVSQTNPLSSDIFSPLEKRYDEIKPSDYNTDSQNHMP